MAAIAGMTPGAPGGHRQMASTETTVSLGVIISTVAKHYKLRASDLKSLRRSHAVTHPRHMAMSLARELSGQSIRDIGAAFWKDNSTVLYAERRIK